MKDVSKNKYTIIILAGGLPFNGNTLSQSSLGGSETGIIYLAKGLADKGNNVTVFCNCQSNSGEFDGVEYKDLSSWNELGAFLTADVLLVSRVSKQLATKCRAKAIYFYCQDVVPDSDNIHNLLWQTDRIALLSPYQRELWNKVEPRYEPHIFEVRNGVDLALVEKARVSLNSESTTSKDKFNFVYSSCPERGLLPLLEMWPRILEKVPNAFLHVTAYDTSLIQASEQVRAIWAKCDHLIALNSGTIKRYNKGLKKFDLYRLLLGCQVLLYPCGFPEISCISLIESMACETLVITTNDYALVDTGGKDCCVLIDGNPVEQSYKDNFIKAAVESASSATYDHLKVAALDKIKVFYQWDTIVDRWHDEFDNFFSSRIAGDTYQVISNLIYHDDVTLASRVLNTFNKSDYTDLRDVCDDRLKPASTVRSNNQIPDHYYPGKTPKGLTLNQLLGSYAAPGDSYNVYFPGCGQGDLAAFTCASFSQLQVYGFESKDQTRESENFYLRSPDSPLSADEKLRLRFEDVSFFIRPKSGFQIVVSDCGIDSSENPRKFIQDLEDNVSNGGLVVLISKEGPWSAGEFRSDPSFKSSRINNLEVEDLKDLVGDMDNFKSQYLVTGTNDREEVLGCWMTAWTKNSKKSIGRIDIMRKFRTFRPYKSVSLCMIGLNEEDNIARCLKSVRNLVDEVIFVDANSTDSTKQIVKSLIRPDALTWVDRPWTDDFSAARNAALRRASGDWILWLDCDEQLINPTCITKYLNSSIFPGFVIQQHHLALDTEMEPDCPIRIFKNNGAKWFGVIHEQAERKMDESIRPTIFLPDVHIAHFGYVNEEIRREKCTERNMKLVYKDREVNPTRRLGKFILAREYRNLIKWDLELSLKNHTGISDKVILLMREVCGIHLANFTDLSDPIHKYSFSIYQEILKMMVKLGVPVKSDMIGIGIKQIPFVFIDNTKELGYEIKNIYFTSEPEYVKFCINYSEGICG